MRIQQVLPKAGVALITIAGCLALAGCASDQTKTEKQTTEHHSAQYQPPAAPPAARQTSSNDSYNNADLSANGQAGTVASTGSNLNLNATPIGKTQDQAAGSIGYQEQRQVVTTQTVNRDLPTVKQSTLKADINRMSASDFVALGIPKNVADNVIKNRDEHGGKFTAVDDLKQVPGMSTAWVDQNKDKLGVSTG